mmetsp:Transcript_25034/g.59535  ORF Transcript_25034/g.59535 Transcript_25034/m.59535 type:complete len:689 (+) Transcript_25034:59-2125(+)
MQPRSLRTSGAVAALLSVAAAALRDPRKVAPALDFGNGGVGAPTGDATPSDDGVAMIPESLEESGFLPLCAPEIVEDTCLLLNADEKHDDGDDWTTSEQLEEQLASYHGAMSEFWAAIGLPQNKPAGTDGSFWVECEALCAAIKNYVQEVAICPPASDVSCYNVEGETFCDLDVRPSILKGQGPREEKDIPDFGDKAFLHEFDDAPQRRGRAREQQVPEKVDYHLWEMVERVANLFRIYPTERPGASSSEDDDEDEDEDDEQESVAGFLQTASGMTPSQARLNKQKEELAKAYMGIVIRAFTGRKTEAQMTRWFGEGTFANATARTEVLRVLNAIDHMISNVHYVFPGPRCRPNTYAYVYPNGYECVKSFEREEPCARMKGTKKYVFYLCPLYFQRPREMVETLVHEGSHHATAFTEDVTFGTRKAYGRTTCQEVAKTDPHKALDNADNFCYYIQDAATEVPDSRFDLSKYQATKCPDFALVDRPDEEGDCRCPRGQLCIYGGEVGCPFSYTSARGTHSTAYFDVECAGCSCAVPDSTTGTSTGTSTSSPTATSTASPTQTCPPFAALTSPDSDGDCYCHGDRECILDGVAGCPFSLTASSGRKSGLYFSAACTGCQCALNTTEVDTTQWCPTFASMRTPDSGGDCYCRAGTSCREGTEASDCPTGNGRRSEGYFSASCESCNCVASD